MTDRARAQDGGADAAGEAARRARLRALWLLALAAGLFGAAWPIMKLGMRDATPLAFAACRAGLAAAVSFAMLAALRRLSWPGRADLPIVLSIGLLQLAAFFCLANVGVRDLPASRVSVLAYSTALWLAPIALLAGESMPARRAVGLALGVAGILAIANPWSVDWSAPGAASGHAAALAAALCWAVAIFHARRHVWRRSPLQLLPWQMALAATALLVATALFEPDAHVGSAPWTLGALVYLGALAGPLATWASNNAARLLPGTVVSLGFLASPILGVALSAVWLGEEIEPAFMAGGALILAGIVVVTLDMARRA